MTTIRSYSTTPCRAGRLLAELVKVPSDNPPGDGIACERAAELLTEMALA